MKKITKEQYQKLIEVKKTIESLDKQQREVYNSALDFCEIRINEEDGWIWDSIFNDFTDLETALEKDGIFVEE